MVCFVGRVCPVSGVSPHGLWLSVRAVPVSPLWVTGPKLWIWGHTALAPIFWECCHPGPRSSTPELGTVWGSPAWLCLPSHLPLVLGSSLCPVHPFSCTGTLVQAGAHFGLVLLEMQKEKPQPRALRGAEAGGLIGSILGEFLRRAGHPLPEPQGARPAFLLRSHACLLPPSPWGESFLAGARLGREGCVFPEDGARCCFLPWWPWDASFVEGHLLSLQNSSCPR